MQRRSARLLLSGLALALLASLTASLVSAIPFEGTVAPSQPVQLRGAMRIDGPPADGFVAAWTPTPGAAQKAYVHGGPFTLSIQEVRWQTTVGGRTPLASGERDRADPRPIGLSFSFNQFDLESPRIQVRDVAPLARWVLTPHYSGPLSVEFGPAADCVAQAQTAQPVNLTEYPGLVVPATAWSGEAASVMSAHCAALQADASGPSVLTFFGTNLTVDYTDPYTHEAATKTVTTGLFTTPALGPPGRIDHRYLKAVMTTTSTHAAWSLPGGPDVWIQTAEARVDGSLHIPNAKGPVSWGDDAITDPGGPLDPSGNFHLAAAGEDGLAIRGHASNLFKDVAVGVGVAGAAAAFLRYGVPGIQALYTRLTEDDVLRHPRRRAVLDVVASNPGIHPEEVARVLGWRRRAVDYHVGILCRQQALVRKRFGHTTALYLPGRLEDAEERRLHRLRKPALLDMLRALETSGGASQGDLMRRLHWGQSRVSRALAELAELGLVAASRAGRRTIYTAKSAPRTPEA